MARKPRKALGSVLAEANAVAPKEKTKRKRRDKSVGWPCTAEQIQEERDTKGFSWRQVAANLGLDNPGQARKAYEELTGRHHSESNPVTNRAPKGSMTRGGRKVENPHWNDDSDQEAIIETLETCNVITVSRSRYGCTFEEDVIVHTVQNLFFDGKEEDGPLGVNLVQVPPDASRTKNVGRGWPVRSFRVADIIAVR